MLLLLLSWHVPLIKYRQDKTREEEALSICPATAVNQTSSLLALHYRTFPSSQALKFTEFTKNRQKICFKALKIACIRSGVWLIGRIFQFIHAWLTFSHGKKFSQDLRKQILLLPFLAFYFPRRCGRRKA